MVVTSKEGPQAPPPPPPNAAAGREHIRWVAASYKKTLTEELKNFYVLRNLAFQKKMNLGGDQASWLGWERLIKSEESAAGLFGVGGLGVFSVSLIRWPRRILGQALLPVRCPRTSAHPGRRIRRAVPPPRRTWRPGARALLPERAPALEAHHGPQRRRCRVLVLADGAAGMECLPGAAAAVAGGPAVALSSLSLK